MNREQILRELCLLEPHEAFNWYALALELRKNNTAEAATVFEKLLLEFPDYLPPYYQAAAFFTEIGNLSSAKMYYQKGIELAQKSGETKTEKELKSALENFIFEYE
jgi:tetratricopeptide (TPR) repeat protein